MTKEHLGDQRHQPAGPPVNTRAKHRAASDRARWRRLSATAVISAQRRPAVEVVDAQTRLTHRVSSDRLLGGRLTGTYEALCGARLLSASLTDPGRGWCQECAR